MAQKTVNVVGGEKPSLTLASGLVSVPVSALAGLGGVEVNARGVVIVNDRQTFRVQGMTDADGNPVEFTASIYVHRTPKDTGEAERIAKAAADQQARKNNKAKEDAEKREREIGRACEITESALAKGYATAQASQTDIAAKLKESLALASMLGDMLPKSLPAGK